MTAAEPARSGRQGLTRRRLLRLAVGGALVGGPLLLRNRPAGYVGGPEADPRAKSAVDGALGGWTELKHTPPEVLDLPIVRAVNYHPGSEQLGQRRRGQGQP